MDFRTCPACHSSVLEDDVEDCPFCGASMSGKPSATPKKAPPAKPAAGKPPTGGANAGSGGKTSGAAGEKKPLRPSANRSTRTGPDETAADEDPFEIDTAAVRRAIKLSPRPTKTRTMEVVCPMCDTKGFLAPSDAGKDVHCCNPKCSLPVFKAPRPQVAQVEETASGPNRTLMLGGGLVAVALLGVGIWFVAFRKPAEQPVTKKAPVNTGPTQEELDALRPKNNEIVVDSLGPTLSLPEIRSAILQQVADKARQRSPGRHAGIGAQGAGEVLAAAGQLDAARSQLSRLRSVAKEVPFFQILPLTEIGWAQLQAKDQAAAKKTAGDIVELTKQGIPRTERASHDAIASAVAFLTAVDMIAEAEQFIQSQQDSGPRGRLSMLWRSAILNRSFNVDTEASRPWHVAVLEPMRMMAVEELVDRGFESQGLQLAQAARNVASQAGCMAAWAGCLKLRQPQQAVSRVQAVASQTEPASAHVRMWCAVASAAHVRNDDPATKSALERANAAAEKILAMAPQPVPKMKAIYESDGIQFVGLPDPAPARAAAMAWADLSALQNAMGDATAAETSLEKATQYVQATAPGAAATSALVAQCSSNEAGVKSQLASALGLGSDSDRIDRAFRQYRKQCGRLDEFARTQRLELLSQLLRHAAKQSLLVPAWQIAKQRTEAQSTSDRDPLFETSAPGLMLAIAQSQGDTDFANQITAAAGGRVLVEPIDQLWADVGKKISAKNYADAGAALRVAFKTELAARDPYRLDQVVLVMSSRVIATAQPSAVMDYIRRLEDSRSKDVKESAYLLLAGHSVTAGSAADVWKLAANSREMSPYEVVALYRGFYAAGTPSASTAASPAAEARSTLPTPNVAHWPNAAPRALAASVGFQENRRSR